MKTTKFLITITAIFLMIGTACQNSAETNKANVNQPVANNAANANQTSANQTPVNKPEVTNPETNLSTGGSLTTPTNTYKVFYAAKQKKDIEGLKKVLSKEALKFFTMMGDGKLDAGLKQLTDGAQAKTAETRNEKIDGATASLEYLNEKGAWSPMDFVKEDGDWKLTIPKEINNKPDDKADKKADVDNRKQQ